MKLSVWFIYLSMKKLLFILILAYCFSCNNKKQKTSIEANAQKQALVKPEYNYSAILKDTIIVSGKEIVFFVPSEDELQIIKKEEGILENDSIYRYQIPRIKQYLRFPKNIKITKTSKRIIGVKEGNRIRYIDRLDYLKSNYGMLMMYNKTYNYVKGFKTEKELYSLIDKFYRNNTRLEKTIDHKYVLARNGLNVRDEEGNVSDKYDYGEFVEIIGYTKDSLEIEDNGNIVKDVWAIIKWKKNGRTEKRYVFKGFLGDQKEVQVFEDQLCYGFFYDEETLYSNNSDAEFKCLADYFDFKLISESEFNAIKLIHNSFLTINPLVKIEENKDESQNVVLPVKDSTLIFNSKVDYSASSHSYYGDVDFLNQYVMHHVYYKAEEAIFTYIDRTTGEKTFMFSDFPIITPDKKQIMCFHYDLYEDRFILEFYKIDNDKSIAFTHGFSFMFWLKPQSGQIKWISNDEFAIQITNKKIWNGSNHYRPQYLKMKFKN